MATKPGSSFTPTKPSGANAGLPPNGDWLNTSLTQPGTPQKACTSMKRSGRYGLFNTGGRCAGLRSRSVSAYTSLRCWKGRDEDAA